jgi:hypothetical protein
MLFAILDAAVAVKVLTVWACWQLEIKKNASIRPGIVLVMRFRRLLLVL